jgi:hypothetical protein
MGPPEQLRAFRPDRGTGKTYRACLEAALSASRGKYIVFVSNTRQHLEHAASMLRSILYPLRVETNLSNNTWMLPGGGRIYFTTWEQHLRNENDGRYRGLKDVYTIFDRF